MVGRRNASLVILGGQYRLKSIAYLSVSSDVTDAASRLWQGIDIRCPSPKCCNLEVSASRFGWLARPPTRSAVSSLIH